MVHSQCATNANFASVKRIVLMFSFFVLILRIFQNFKPNWKMCIALHRIANFCRPQMITWQGSTHDIDYRNCKYFMMVINSRERLQLFKTVCYLRKFYILLWCRSHKCFSCHAGWIWIILSFCSLILSFTSLLNLTGILRGY